LSPESNLTIIANASLPSGIIKGVELFANDQSLGEVTLSSTNEYNLTWEKIRRGIWSIYAVATDGSGITTTSATVAITVGKRPSVTVVSPSEGTRFPASTNLSVKVKATQPEGSVRKIDFFANDKLIGTANDIGTEKFLLTWRNVPEGFYSLTAVATDDLGVAGKSAPVRVIVGNPSNPSKHYVLKGEPSSIK